MKTSFSRMLVRYVIIFDRHLQCCARGVCSLIQTCQTLPKLLCHPSVPPSVAHQNITFIKLSLLQKFNLCEIEATGCTKAMRGAHITFLNISVLDIRTTAMSLLPSKITIMYTATFVQRPDLLNILDYESDTLVDQITTATNDCLVSDTLVDTCTWEMITTPMFST